MYSRRRPTRFFVSEFHGSVRCYTIHDIEGKKKESKGIAERIISDQGLRLSGVLLFLKNFRVRVKGWSIYRVGRDVW